MMWPTNPGVTKPSAESAAVLTGRGQACVPHKDTLSEQHEGCFAGRRLQVGLLIVTGSQVDFVPIQRTTGNSWNSSPSFPSNYSSRTLQACPCCLQTSCSESESHIKPTPSTPSPRHPLPKTHINSDSHVTSRTCVRLTHSPCSHMGKAGKSMHPGSAGCSDSPESYHSHLALSCTQQRPDNFPTERHLSSAHKKNTRDSM